MASLSDAVNDGPKPAGKRAYLTWNLLTYLIAMVGGSYVQTSVSAITGQLYLFADVPTTILSYGLLQSWFAVILGLPLAALELAVAWRLQGRVRWSRLVAIGSCAVLGIAWGAFALGPHGTITLITILASGYPLPWLIWGLLFRSPPQ